MKKTTDTTRNMTVNQELATLFPLLCVGVICILCIVIYATYQHAFTVPPKIMLPGGTTYLGQ